MKNILTNLKEIAHLTKLHERANFDFRALLKRKISDEDWLDSQVLTLYNEVASKIDCRACGNCCKTYDIILIGHDLERLARELGMTPADFKSQYLEKAKDEDGFCFRTKPCPFLKDNTCGQYEARPAVCREYPHLNKSGFLGRTLMVIGNCSTCPIVFNVWENLKKSTFCGHRRKG